MDTTKLKFQDPVSMNAASVYPTLTQAKAFQRSISEEDAHKLASKISLSFLAFFPEFDSDLVKEMVPKLVQNRVQITELVESVCPISSFPRSLTIRTTKLERSFQRTNLSREHFAKLSG